MHIISLHEIIWINKYVVQFILVTEFMILKYIYMYKRVGVIKLDLYWVVVTRVNGRNIQIKPIDLNLN